MQTMEMIVNVGLFIGGLALLVRGSDYLIQSATTLAKSFGVSDLLIGLTIVAIGTSLPEVMASLAASAAGGADLAFANILGSSITNITLVAGIGALAAPLSTNHIVLDRDTKIMILIGGMLTLMVFNPFAFGMIVIPEAAILLLLLVAYLSFLYWGRTECDRCYQFTIFVDFFLKFKFLTSIRSAIRDPPGVSSSTSEETEPLDKIILPRDVIIMAISAVAVAIGAQWVISGTEYISMASGIKQDVIGFTVISLATSLPEISVSINSARHGFGRLLVGNLVGSNIINIALGLGLVPIIFPGILSVIDAGILLVSFLVLSFIFYYVIRKDWRVTRAEGIGLVTLYLLVQAIFISLAQGVFG
ncbi:MAG: sodium:calcium antiporter [Candidatus Thorarchaeota archaeon]|nr:sodium:calcium antiporter [Candidatus Thorarchaeota archaeon]